jgi:protein phosphatase
VTNFSRKVFEKALEYVCAQLDKEDTEDGDYKMGTTLTFICFSARGVFMAHIGDSRIYHLRRRECRVDILYRSRDHSLVNDLLLANIITPEEAAIHPKRNVITRVVQPNQEKPVQADIRETKDVAAGDYFFLCTDGILEAVSDGLLCDIAGRDIDDESKMKAIHEACQKRSMDNFSAYLIPVAAVEFL